ncbi:hypothetical protein CCP3SC15_6300001 [Gammaproteobacteria bacterium]
MVSTAPAGYIESQTKVVLDPATEYSTTLMVKSVAARTMVAEPNQQALVVQEPYRGWVSFPPASLLNTSGTPVSEPVTAQITTLDLMSGDRPAFPGNDFLGLDPTETTVSLAVVVVAEVKLVGASGTHYHPLATPATLRLAIPGALLGRLADGDTIPLWYYDITIGRWRQEGMGTIRRDPIDGRLWAEGQVAHMSWWSFAYPLREVACLRFRPIDAETGTSLRRVPFIIEGITFISGALGTTQGDEIAFTSKKTQHSSNPEQVRLMFYEKGISTYLRQDPTNSAHYYKVSMPGLATPIAMPSVAGRHTAQWDDCQDLGLLSISSATFVGTTIRSIANQQ